MPKVAYDVASSVVLALGVAQVAWAEPSLPYATRTRSYSAWDTTVRGDLRTVGMAGAMVGLADSALGAMDNPAGLAMTVDSTGLHFTGNSIHDGNIQSYPSLLTANSFIATGSWYPWGLGIASWTPQSEGELYRIGNQSGMLSVKTHEYHLSAARMALGDHISLGATVILGQSTQVADFGGAGGPWLSRDAWGYGLGLGALYQLPHRWLVGVSYTTPIHYGMGGSGPDAPGVNRFFQDAESPYRTGVGVGWVPNRFFRFGASISMFGSTANVALLSDNSRTVGESLTFQPRCGVSYFAIEYKELKVDVALGTYLEVLRISDESSRLHWTMGVEFHPWIFNIGWGIDEARFYENFTYSAGVDLAQVLRKLDLIPQEKKYPNAGLFPNPTHLSEVGLPRTLVRTYVDDGSGENIIDTGLRMPERIMNRFFNAPGDVLNFGNEIIDSIGDLSGQLRDQGSPLLKEKLEFPLLSPPAIKSAP